MGENARFVDDDDADDGEPKSLRKIYIQITICQSFLDARDSRCPGRSRFQHIAQRGETAEKEKRKFDLSFERLISAETAAAAAAAPATQMVNG